MTGQKLTEYVQAMVQEIEECATAVKKIADQAAGLRREVRVHASWVTPCAVNVTVAVITIVGFSQAGWQAGTFSGVPAVDMQHLHIVVVGASDFGQVLLGLNLPCFGAAVGEGSRVGGCTEDQERGGGDPARAGCATDCCADSQCLGGKYHGRMHG